MQFESDNTENTPEQLLFRKEFKVTVAERTKQDHKSSVYCHADAERGRGVASVGCPSFEPRVYTAKTAKPMTMLEKQRFCECIRIAYVHSCFADYVNSIGNSCNRIAEHGGQCSPENAHACELHKNHHADHFNNAAESKEIDRNARLAETLYYAGESLNK